MPPAFNLSQDQTLQFISCGRRNDLSLLDRVSSLRRYSVDYASSLSARRSTHTSYLNELLKNCRFTSLQRDRPFYRLCRRRQATSRVALAPGGCCLPCREGGATIPGNFWRSTDHFRLIYRASRGSTGQLGHRHSRKAALANLIDMRRSRRAVPLGVLQALAIDAYSALPDHPDGFRGTGHQPRGSQKVWYC
jgi:hypothetical protein